MDKVETFIHLSSRCSCYWKGEKDWKMHFKERLTLLELFSLLEEPRV